MTDYCFFYQCADLTLAQNYSVPSNISCTNSTSNSTSGAGEITATGYAGALGFLVALLTV
jgi:hypothetical protein